MNKFIKIFGAISMILVMILSGNVIHDYVALLSTIPIVYCIVSVIYIMHYDKAISKEDNLNEIILKERSKNIKRAELDREVCKRLIEKHLMTKEEINNILK